MTIIGQWYIVQQDSAGNDCLQGTIAFVNKTQQHNTTPLSLLCPHKAHCVFLPAGNTIQEPLLSQHQVSPANNSLKVLLECPRPCSVEPWSEYLIGQILCNKPASLIALYETLLYNKGMKSCVVQLKGPAKSAEVQLCREEKFSASTVVLL